MIIKIIVIVNIVKVSTNVEKYLSYSQKKLLNRDCHCGKVNREKL